jgi:hypothetical protein
VTREDVKSFLKGQESYVLSQGSKRRVNKSVVANVRLPDELWQIDLIEFSQQYAADNTVVQDVAAAGAATRGGPRTKTVTYKYVFSCLDAFSRRVMLEPLAEKTSEACAQALWAIFQRNPEETTPSSVQSDNCLEFQGAFAQYLKDNSIRQRLSRGYSPQANGAVEQSNKQVRKVHLVRARSNYAMVTSVPRLLHILQQIPPRQVAILDHHLLQRQKIKAGQGKDLIVRHAPVQLRVTKVVLPSDKIVERRSYQLSEWYSPYRKLYAVKVGADGAKRYTLAKVYASSLIKSTLPYQHLKMNGVEKRSSDLVFLAKV